jgi:hypothetical protein
VGAALSGLRLWIGGCQDKNTSAPPVIVAFQVRITSGVQHLAPDGGSYHQSTSVAMVQHLDSFFPVRLYLLLSILRRAVGSLSAWMKPCCTYIDILTDIHICS